MWDKNDTTDLTIVLIMSAIVLGLVFLTTNCNNNNGETEYQNMIDTYETFTVNGETFNTSDVVDVDYGTRFYESDNITFYMKDGSKITAQQGTINWHKEK